jgi:hypothetical protein
MHDRKQPSAQVALAAPQMPTAEGTFEAVLHEIVGGAGIAQQGPRVATQPRDVLLDLMPCHGHDDLATFLQTTGQPDYSRFGPGARL